MVSSFRSDIFVDLFDGGQRRKLLMVLQRGSNLPTEWLPVTRQKRLPVCRIPWGPQSHNDFPAILHAQGEVISLATAEPADHGREPARLSIAASFYRRSTHGMPGHKLRAQSTTR